MNKIGTRNVRIVTDSSANLAELESIPFGAAPLKVVTDERSFTDDASLDVGEMVKWFGSYKGRSRTSCPNPSDWLEAFGDGEDVFCVTITSGLSGSYNTAIIAKQMYEEKHPGRRVCVIDSLSAGPEMVLMIEKLRELICLGMGFEDVCREIGDYRERTGLVFILESLKNFAANGRVSPGVAKLAGVLGIRIVGRASEKGTLEPTDKCRGSARAMSCLVNSMKKAGLSHGKVRIAYCGEPEGALELKALIEETVGKAEVSMHPCRGLCSYYAEKGGLLVGFEKF